MEVFCGSEKYLRHIIMPVECLLVHYKRLVLKDSSIAAIAHGAKFMLPGKIVLAFFVSF